MVISIFDWSFKRKCNKCISNDKMKLDCTPKLLQLPLENAYSKKNFCDGPCSCNLSKCEGKTLLL